MIRTFRKVHPGVTLALRERLPSEQTDALLNDEIDIGFARSIPPDVKHLVQHELLFREPVIAAIPRAHPFAKLDNIATRHLASESLVFYCREAAPEVYDAITSPCQKARFSPRVADTPRSWQSLLTMVEAEEGIGLIPHCVQYLRSSDIVYKLRGSPCRIDALIAWRRDGLSRVQESFLELIRSKKAALQMSIGRA